MDRPVTATADVNGNATALMKVDKSGVQWHVWQVSVETIPVRSSSRATLRRNGRYVSSTITGSGATAFGPPALLLNQNDQLTVDWIGMTAGDECIATPFYEEVQWGQPGTGFGLV